jgi:hypothetical protein
LSDKRQALDLGLPGITKQALTNVRPYSQKPAQSNQLIRLVSAWEVAATPKNIIASFRRSGIVVRWEKARGYMVAAVTPEEVDRVQEVSLHEQIEDKMGMRFH